MNELDALQQWPAHNVAAGVVNGANTSTTGDVHRVFELASVTKPIVAYGVLVAVEEGVFDLDTPLGPAGSTVRHLLAHASGVGFASREPERAPGERRIYSSAGFEILADAIGEESGIDFPDYLREAVFDPLGMRDTNLYGSAGHGATSTVHDLLLFVAEVLQPTLLDVQTVADAASVQFPELSGIVPGYGMFKPCPWGLGFEVKGSKGASREHWTGTLLPPDTIGHFGQSGTFLWVHRPSMRAMAVLTDYAFGTWAKPLWSETNDAIWRRMNEG